MNVPEANEGALEKANQLALTLTLSRRRERGNAGLVHFLVVGVDDVFLLLAPVSR